MANSNDFLSDDLAILAEFVDESETGLDAIASMIVDIESKPDDMDLINAVFRPFHSIKGNSAFLGLMHTRNLAHELEWLLDDLRKRRQKPSRPMIDALLAGMDELKAVMGRIRKTQPEVVDPAAFEKLILLVRDCHTASATIPVQPSSVAPSTVPDSSGETAVAVAPAPAAAPAGKELARTLRVQENLIDGLQQHVADLASVHKQLQSSREACAQARPEALASPLSQLATCLEMMDDIVKAMAHQLTALKNVPMRELLQRAPRIARETATLTGKTVQVHLAGEDLLAPKSLIEGLESPLMHMVRNAVDHGIESAADRIKNKKPQEGNLWVEARETPESIILKIADDGGGIDFKTLLMKAISGGLVPKNRAMTPEDVTNLIFLPGLSAAKKVTDLSGRGVGMDVVKTNISALGGRISVSSKMAKGTEFLVTLPKG